MRVERIGSLEDPRVADYRDVRDAELRDGANLFITEGRLGVRRLLRSARFRARSVFVTPAALDGMVDALQDLGEQTPVYLASQALLSRVVGYPMHRGCLAAAERGEEPRAETLLESGASGRRRVVALEDVTNPENVGAVFRNALAFGVDAVLLTARCADPLYRKSIRVSMGATLQLPFARVEDAADGFARLREAGFPVVACTPGAGAEPIHAAAARLAGARRLALAFGTEGEGLSEAALAAADARVRIPMAPGVDSLNVATASGIALHRLAGTEAPCAP